MPRKLHVQVIAAIVVLVFAGGIAVTGDSVDSSWLRFFGLAVFTAVLALGAWEHFIWKWSLLQKLHRIPPDLNGSWRGTLRTLWASGDGTKPDPKQVVLVVRQTFSTMSVTLLTDESRSATTLAELSRKPQGDEVHYIYQNRPLPSREDESRAHYGAVVLDVVGRPATALDGRYWTDRDSRGEVSFVERRAGHVSSLNEAERLFDRGAERPKSNR